MRHVLAVVDDPEQRERGFTLIELLVVIIVIGILAAIAIPIFLNQKKKASDATLKSDVRNAAAQIESALTDSQATPITGSSAASGANFNVGGQTVVVSSGNKLAVSGSGTAGYCVVGSNVNGSTMHYWYSSTTGATTSSAPTATGDACKGVAAP